MLAAWRRIFAVNKRNEMKRDLEITCWRAKFFGEIRIGWWERGGFKRLAGVPVKGEFITKSELRKAEKIRAKLADSGDYSK